MRQRKNSERFGFDYEYYMSDEMSPQRMLRIKIYCEGPTQTVLWLDESDQKKLKEVLGE